MANDARGWAGLPDPWAAGAITAHVTTHRGNQVNLKAAYESRFNLWVSPLEQQANYTRKHGELARYWDAFPLPGYRGGFVAADAFGVPQRLRVVDFPEDGNSLWYCLAYVVMLFDSPKVVTC
jgi:hypothetical protein